MKLSSAAHVDALARERRARMAAERLLLLKQAELSEANRKLARHARVLSDEIVEKREETEALIQHTSLVQSELDHANQAVLIAERRLWDSVETIQDGFAVFDADDIMIAANSAYLQPFDGVNSIGPGIAYGDLMRVALDEGMIDIGDGGAADWLSSMLERWYKDPIEPRTIKLWNGAYVKLVDRRAAGGDTVSLALNITDQIRSEAKLRAARHRAEAANRAKSAFLANMSHEIRTPMNGVVGMADLLGETSLDDEQRLYADTIKTFGEALLVMINDILDYSKIEADKLTLHSVPFDLERSIHEIMILMRPSVQDRDLDLLVDFDLHLPTGYVGDPGRVRQVLTNLIGNAVKFTEKGHVLVRVVGISEKDGTRQRLNITVEDTGIGIPPDMTEHIFGEFNQVENERNRSFDGTGLGLAITKRLVDLMGGEVWVDSAVGRGSSFGFNLTLEAAQVDEPAPVPMPDWMRRIILADGQAMNRNIVQRQLVARKIEVATCRSMTEALALRPGSGDVVMVDQNLSDAPGMALVSALRDGDFAGPILYSVPGPAVQADTTQVTRVLQRPLGRRELYAEIAKLTLHQPIADAASDTPEEPLRQMRILAAEDNKTNRLVFSKMIKDLDIDLTFAVNGEEAVDAFSAQKFDLIFMDISMPLVDGKEATRRIRAIETERGLARTTIVALTAHALSGDEAVILEAGLDYYLTKPLRKRALLHRIAEETPKHCRPAQPPEPEGTPE